MKDIEQAIRDSELTVDRTLDTNESLSVLTPAGIVMISTFVETSVSCFETMDYPSAQIVMRRRD